MGIFVDQTYDIGRIEDVHWNPWFSMDQYLSSFLLGILLLTPSPFIQIGPSSNGNNKTEGRSLLLALIGNMYSTLSRSDTTLDTSLLLAVLA